MIKSLAVPSASPHLELGMGGGTLITRVFLVVLALSCWGEAPPGARDTSSTARGRALTPSVSAEPHTAPLYSGCRRVRAGPICEIERGAGLTLWMPSSFRGYRLMQGEVEVMAGERAVAGGYQVRITVDAEQGELSLRERRTGQGVKVWHLALAFHQPSAAVDRANAAKDAGEFEQALALAETVKREGSPLESALAEGIQARVYLRQGRAADASELLLRSSEQLLAQGQVSELARDVFARLFILLQRTHELDAARAWLARFREPLSSYPLGRALLGDHEGMLRASAGESVAALQYYREAGRQYARLGEEAHARRAQKEQVGLLSDIGQTVAASALQRALLDPAVDEPDCAQAQLYTLHAWLTLLELEEGQLEHALMLPKQLDDSEAWARRCGDPEILLTGVVNRGLWALGQRDWVSARKASTELRTLPQSQNPELRAWVSELEGRFALARKQYRQARSHFEAERLIGQSSGRLDPELRGLLGLAKIELGRGRLRAGEQILHDAIAVLDRAEHWAPFGPVLHSQFASRQRAARELVQTLVLRKNDAEAYRVGLAAYRSALGIQARQSRIEGWPAAARQRWQELLGEFAQRRRALDELAQGDWKLSAAELEVSAAQREAERRNLESLLQRAAEVVPGSQRTRALPAPGSGEYWLLVLPTPAGSDPGWIALGTDGREVRSARLLLSELAPAQPEAPTHPLLVAFEAPILRSKSVVLLFAGAARSWPVERWKLRGEPFSARQLAFGAALARTEASPAQVSGGVSSIIANPRNDLPYSEQEGELAARLLGVSRDRWLVGPRATASNLLSQLESSDFLHFAGHARSSGEEGAALLLAGGSELLPWELFGLRSVPREVVLSACYAAASESPSVGVGWGFAQALLAIGAQSVIAPVEALDDRQALVVQQRFYKGIQQGLSFRDAFWRAQLEEATERATFRLFVR